MRYEPLFLVGSEDEDGSHRRDTEGWPYSVFKKAVEIGATDIVLCRGIARRKDAEQLCRLVNNTDAVESGPEFFLFN